MSKISSQKQFGQEYWIHNKTGKSEKGSIFKQKNAISLKNVKKKKTVQPERKDHFAI